MAMRVEDPAELIKSDFQSLPLVEILQKPPNVLLGVSDDAAAALGQLGVRSVFDLALSRVFAAADEITRAADDATSALNRFGAPPSDVLSGSLPPDARVPDLRFMAPTILAGISNAAAFSNATGAKTVRDVALWPPYLAAREILNTAFFPDRASTEDPEAPSDLIPKSGQYPTERTQYQVLLLDEIRRPPGAAPLLDIAGAEFKPVDVSPAASPDFGFNTIGTGALLTFNQSWFMQGVTLGHLLHSMTLAPGESTRIAVVDWSRKSRAGQTEQVAETEDLLDDTSHNRSISEVTQAVATDAQSGFSHAQTESYTQQAGISAGLGLAGIVDGVAGALGIGGSASEGGTSGSADSYSSSFGQRDVAASMTQQINDRTHQHAHAARSRRASVVREVSQSEHDDISTRVVTNYNHMHAMTVQYYEVLQLYRTETSVARADRVVFIPFKLVDFNKDDLLRRFRGILSRAALTPQIRDALTNFDTLELAPDQKVRFPGLGGAIGDILVNPTMLRVATMSRSISSHGTTSGRSGADASHTAGDPASASAGTDTAANMALPVSATAVRKVIGAGLWASQVVGLTKVIGAGIIRRNSPSLFVPSDVMVVDAEVYSASGQSLAPVFYHSDGSQLQLGGSPIALSDVARIAIHGSKADADIDATLALTLSRNSVVFPLELPTVTIAKAATETQVVQINAAGADVNLKQHLSDNRLYYSQSVFRSLDSAALAGLLAGFSMTLNGQAVPLAQTVDPLPLRVVGNFLAFRISSDPTADQEWSDFLKRRGISIGQARVEFVPLSSGGVFAEAVLGRFNSAEKLDITRFWNWQDSPIPIQPSDIAPIQAVSRAQSDSAISPGQLSAPIVNITPPTSLPDPTGMAGVLTAIQNGNMFRDMSGMSEVVRLAQTAIQASSAGATAAGQQASSNEQNAVNAAADIFKAKLAANKSSAADKSASQQGALINEQDKRRAASGGTAGSAVPIGGASSGNGSGPRTTGANSISGPNGNGVFVPPNTSSGNPALDVATYGSEGKPVDEAIRDTPALGQNPDVQLASYTNAALLDAFRNWASLLLFKVPADVEASLSARNMDIQYAFNESYSDYLNFDLYPVRIDTFPTIGGAILDAQTLAAYIRANINSLLDTSIAKFSPYDAATDGPLWASADPVKAVLRIDMLDNAAVVVSQASVQGWLFTTVTTPNTGRHPVSGHRRFFIAEKDGVNYFINKGLDMTSTGVAGMGLPVLGEWGYGKADQLWSGLQDKLVSFINANGGKASTEKRFSERVDWRLVYNQYKVPLERVFGQGAGSASNSPFITI